MKLVRRFLRRELQNVLGSITNPAHRRLVSIGQRDADTEADHDVLTPGTHRLFAPDKFAAHLIATQDNGSRDVVLIGALNHVEDVYSALEGVATSWSPETRLINISYNRLWRPFVAGLRLFTRDSSATENWVPPGELENLLEQSGFEVIERRFAVLLPVPVPLLSRFVNRWLAPLPVLRLFCVYNVVVARPVRSIRPSDPSVSIVIAARNEEGNIASLLERIPKLADRQEIIFVEGGSTDNTWEAIQRTVGSPNSSGSSVKVFKQTGKGKGDAVRLGFEKSTGDILIILDADISVPPEELTRFIDLLRTNSCEFANGSRLVYPMEKEAMQFLNLIGNRLFGVVFTFLLGQPVRDTLCGTKALWANDYQRIAAQRSYFGDFDPFGDFDLLFGASRLHLKIRDVPVHYKERIYGSTNISRFRHGLLLLRMTLVAARKLRFV
jgi:hypothetical protein